FPPLIFLVKYIKEVTSYIKKPSLLSELPWEGAVPQSPNLSGSEDSGSPRHLNGSKDKKLIPLKMCYVTRNLSMPDVENRLIELHSPDGRHSIVLRCKDTATAHSWFTAIHSNVASLLPQVLAEINTVLGTTGSTASKEIRHIGWLAEQVRLEGGRQQWRPVIMALTEKEILLFDCMPWVREAWTAPCQSHPLLSTRLVHSGSARGSPSLSSELTFATRTGSRQGIETHLFRVETHRDLSLWTRMLVQGCHSATELIKEISQGCTLNGQELKLTVHYENGFTISKEGTVPGAFSVLYRYPFEKLKMSADDGIRTLYLDFGGPEGELSLDLHSCPKPLVFVLHSFLSAKVTRMGLLV
uniref:Syntrophin beta 2 n=1 Tax=Latimeria chalumnae TaxID=7897 RepID=H3ADU4_LATCH